MSLPVLSSTTSVNGSVSHPSLFSAYTRTFTSSQFWERLCTTYRLYIIVSVDENSLLLRIVTDAPKNGGGQRQFVAVHDVLPEVDELGGDTEALQLTVQPGTHLEHIWTVCAVPAYTS